MNLIPTKPYYQAHKLLYEPTAKAIAKKWGIPERVFLNLITAESSWNPDARSHAGALGLTQLMPSTITGMGATVARVKQHPTLQMSLGARYLKKQYTRFHDWKLAVAAYNAGPGVVKKYGGVPPYDETRKYVEKVMSDTDLPVDETSKSLQGQPAPLNMIITAFGTYSIMAVMYVLVAGLALVSSYFVFRKDAIAIETGVRRVKKINNTVKTLAKKNIKK